MRSLYVPLHGNGRNLLSSRVVAHLASGDRMRPEFYAVAFRGIENEAKYNDGSTICHGCKFSMFPEELVRVPAAHQLSTGMSYR